MILEPFLPNMIRQAPINVEQVLKARHHMRAGTICATTGPAGAGVWGSIFGWFLLGRTASPPPPRAEAAGGTVKPKRNQRNIDPRTLAGSKPDRWWFMHFRPASHTGG